MLSKSTRLILSKAVAEQDKKTLSFIIGLCLAIIAGLGFSSWTPPWFIKLATGMGAGLTIAVVSASLLALTILVTGTYRYGMVQWAYFGLHNWATPKLAKTIFALLGISAGTLAFWFATDSQSALQTFLIALLMAFCMAWNWAGLAICQNELSKRFAR